MYTTYLYSRTSSACPLPAFLDGCRQIPLLPPAVVRSRRRRCRSSSPARTWLSTWRRACATPAVRSCAQQRGKFFQAFWIVAWAISRSSDRRCSRRVPSLCRGCFMAMELTAAFVCCFLYSDWVSCLTVIPWHNQFWLSFHSSLCHFAMQISFKITK